MLIPLLAIAAVVLGFLAFVSSRPDQFRIQRSTRIRAAPAAIYPLIEDFHRWKEWSPYEALDPTLLRTYSGAARGKGAVYEWKGNEKAGAGRMEILEASQPAKLVIKLDFLKPFEGHNTAEFDLRADGETTEVTWAMHGPSNFMAKLVGLAFSMDTLLGKDFEAGLAKLKAASET